MVFLLLWWLGSRCWHLQHTRQTSMGFVRPGLTCRWPSLLLFHMLGQSQSTAQFQRGGLCKKNMWDGTYCVRHVWKIQFATPCSILNARMNKGKRNKKLLLAACRKYCGYFPTIHFIFLLLVSCHYGSKGKVKLSCAVPIKNIQPPWQKWLLSGWPHVPIYHIGRKLKAFFIIQTHSFSQIQMKVCIA